MHMKLSGIRGIPGLRTIQQCRKHEANTLFVNNLHHVSPLPLKLC